MPSRTVRRLHPAQAAIVPPTAPLRRKRQSAAPQRPRVAAGGLGAPPVPPRLPGGGGFAGSVETGGEQGGSKLGP